jgi:hypothetical protein
LPCPDENYDHHDKKKRYAAFQKIFTHRNYIKDRRKDTRVEVGKILKNMNDAAHQVDDKHAMLK